VAQENARPELTDRDNAGPGREFSAGGVVVDEGRVLMVRVRNLRNQLVWTFPKGHVEEGETAREAAVREVEEETGYKVRILGPIFTARYRFQRAGRAVQKRVEWFWMRPGARLGKPDEAEIHGVRWVALRNAEELIRYPSDHDLVERTKRRFAPKPEGTA
jgi:ADP-ribose pyrophosphatase YjhB (NUDIX family)